MGVFVGIGVSVGEGVAVTITIVTLSLGSGTAKDTRLSLTGSTVGVGVTPGFTNGAGS
jgi:hypothetical protein